MSELARLVLTLAVEAAAYTRGLREASDKTKSFTDQLRTSAMEIKAKIDLAQQTIQSFAGAVREAFEFTEEGAQIRQLGESFARTGVDIEALRRAARGTVDDVSLMSQSMTLLAGTSGELRDQLAESLPRLLEIAKASNKLNPTLGDTSFLFQSLATGVKRGSQLLIDNTGITFTASEAYERYAASVGKTADELDDTEKKLALLQMTLERGQTLIDQAGGTTESYADAWAQLRAEVENTTNAMKAQAAELAGPLMRGMAEQLALVRRVREDYGDAAASAAYFHSTFRTGGRTLADYRKELELNARAIEAGTAAIAQGYRDVGTAARVQRDYRQEITRTNSVLSGTALLTLQYNYAIESQAEAVDRATSRFRYWQDVLRRGIVPDMQALTAIMAGPLREENERYAQEQEELTSRARELSETLQELEATHGRLTGATRRYIDNSKKIAEVREEYQQTQDKLAELTAAHEESTKRILFDLLSQRAAIDGLTEAEFLALQRVAEQWGLIDEKTLRAVESFDGWVRRLDEGKDTVDEFTERVVRMGERMLELPKEHTFTIRINQIGNMPLPSDLTRPWERGEPPQFMAAGGFLPPGGIGIVGDNGPEVIQVTPAGARVAPITNNWNITFHEATNPVGAVEMMRALYGVD